MTIPDSLTQVLVTLVLIVPGFVYQNVRIRVAGRTPADTELSSRILRAIVTSTIFGLFYVLALGSTLTDFTQARGTALEHPRMAALIGFGAAFVMPTLAAILLNVPKPWLC